MDHRDRSMDFGGLENSSPLCIVQTGEKKCHVLRMHRVYVMTLTVWLGNNRQKH